MITLRKAGDRGHTNLGWLDTYHTFSFGSYRDPDHMGFKTLRVINHDFVHAGAGFDPHPHRDMEIVSYIISGEITHRDSMGNETIVREGEVQRMTAGSGIVHSEHNYGDKTLELLQIWIRPAQRNLRPGYEQKLIPRLESGWQLLVSPDGAEGSLRIHQKARIWEGNFRKGDRISLPLTLGNDVWLQGVRGRFRVGGNTLEPGDGASLTGVSEVVVEGVENGRLVAFELE